MGHFKSNLFWIEILHRGQSVHTVNKYDLSLKPSVEFIFPVLRFKDLKLKQKGKYMVKYFG